MHSKILVRYHEIALKGSNRKWFEEALTKNIKLLIKAELPDEAIEVTREPGRILIHHPLNPSIANALHKTFGISNYSPIYVTQSSKDKILDDIPRFFEDDINEAKTFRVLTRRSAKKVVESSMDLDREVGSLLLKNFPHLKVQLKKPDLVIGIEINHKETFLWAKKIPGPSGLPVSTNGSLLALLSGGIDSPVAALMCLKRGASTSFIHFYGAPFVGIEALHKVEDLARLINRYQPKKKPLFICEFGDIQKSIATLTKPAFRTVLYRRMMFRIAEKHAKKIKCLGLVSGESLGQVASQTLENLGIINSSIQSLVLRPLIGMDKDEIILQSQKYGTYETAIIQADDCCTLFAERSPSIWTNINDIFNEEAKLNIEEIVEMGVSKIYKSPNV